MEDVVAAAVPTAVENSTSKQEEAKGASTFDSSNAKDDKPSCVPATSATGQCLEQCFSLIFLESVVVTEENLDAVLSQLSTILDSDAFDTIVMDFIDAHCSAFQHAVEENPLLYTQIHQDFISTVDTTLCNLINISCKGSLERALGAVGDRTRTEYSTLFARLAAMEDFEIFKKLMVKRAQQLFPPTAKV